MSASVSQLEQKINYKFQNKSLAELALTHRSAGHIHNERLEFLGDSILGFTVAEVLFSSFPEASEGDLSRMRSALVNKETLALIARELDLGSLLMLGQGELKSGGRERISILADAVEAIIGAIYLDTGIRACRNKILELLIPYMPDASPGNVHKDSKTRLQELLQAQGHDVPRYEVVSISGEAHQQSFSVSCCISLLPEPAFGNGSNRRLAEQQAAQAALRLLDTSKCSNYRGDDV
jgi:ribonuclease III